MTNKLQIKRILFITCLSGVLAIFFNLIPIYHYQVVAPGIVKDVRSLIKVENGTLPFQSLDNGRLYLTTVVTGKATFLTLLYALVTPWTEIIYSKTDDTNEHLERDAGISMMEESKLIAILVALKKAGYEAKIKGSGVEVLDITNESKAIGILKEGDIITAIDGQLVTNREDLLAYLSNKIGGDKVQLTFFQEGKTYNKKIQTIKLPATKLPKGKKGAILGIHARTYKIKIEAPVKVHIESQDIQGSSAGLMFALGIIEKLWHKDLAKGYRIAGTGTILPDGSVGGIEGVGQKVIAARLAGAQIFFVPEINTEEARKGEIGIRIVAVRNIDDAITFLEKLPVAR